MTFEIGLMSVTFRELGITDVVGLAAENALQSISWTGDVHVPPGDHAAAESARNATHDAGLRTEGYGSYWRATDEPIEPWLEAATAVGAPRVRIWAGERGSAQTAPGDRSRITERIAAATDLAEARGLELALEFHLNTLTETGTSTAQLLHDVAELRGPGLRSYWQPRPGVDVATSLAELDAIDDALAALHVFSWDENAARYPLERNRDDWHVVLGALASRQAPAELMLEFVRDDDPGQLAPDVASLRSLIATLEEPDAPR